MENDSAFYILIETSGSNEDHDKEVKTQLFFYFLFLKLFSKEIIPVFR